MISNLATFETKPDHVQHLRSLFVLSSVELDDTVIRSLAEAQWSVTRCGDIREAKDMLAQHRYTVGIVVLPAEHNFDLNRLEGVLAKQETYWISIVDPIVRDSERFRRVLLRQLYDFHTLPINVPSLVSTIGHAHGVVSLQPDVDSEVLHSNGPQSMIGGSDVMKENYRQLSKASRVNASILLNGESGCGKQLAAQTIHQLSARSSARFIPVNCSGSEEITAQNLFGREQTSGSGLREVAPGGLEAANNGTAFLSHIDALSLGLQERLVSFLESGQLQRENGTSMVAASPRIIASTQVDLERMVETGAFREDLYYLIKVINLSVPPLRSRIGDMELLAEHFFTKYKAEGATRIRGFSNQALLAMHRYPWPGNIRELENRVRQALALCNTALIQASDMALEESIAPEDILSLEAARIKAEGSYIRNALYRNFHNVTETAQQLGVSRVTLYRLMKKYNIDIETERQSPMT